LILADALQYVVRSRALRTLLLQLSFSGRYRGFTQGIVDVADLCFFVSVAGLFVALTAVALERRRWV